jgi:hypothetical protein
MQEAESVTDELKENDRMAWIKAMNSIHNRAEDIVLREMVYGEDAVWESLKSSGMAISSRQSMAHPLEKRIRNCWN